MSKTNPYETPKADLTKRSGSFLLKDPKAVSVGRGWDWIVEGFGHFKKDPGAWILTIIVYFVLSIVLSLIPILGQLALMLISYVLFAGFMLGCQAQSKGEKFEVKYLFAGFSTNAGRLVLLSVVVLLVVLVVMGIAMGPTLFTLIQGGMQTDPAMAQSMVNEILLPMLIAMLFLIPLMMAVYFAPALIVLNDQPLIQAMKLSFIGCLKNILPFLIYGIIALILYILGCIPLLLGLLVVIPTVIASIYVAYQDIFIE